MGSATPPTTTASSTPYLDRFPSKTGHYGPFGGNHYPPSAAAALAELASTYAQLRTSASFQTTLNRVRTGLQGRPTPIHHLSNISTQIGGAQIYVKREDLNHTGAHKINHCVGFALLAKHMGKTKLIAETGAGQHGVALATAAAYFGLQCEVHMGAVDVVKQQSNVGRMRILGAEVVSVGDGQGVLKEASDSAFESYVRQSASALYAIGSAIGPHPFPWIVRDFQSVVGVEARGQWGEMMGPEDEEGGGRGLPDHVVACVAGGSNAMGLFSAFVDDEEVVLHAVEPAGKAIGNLKMGQHAATLTFGKMGTLHGAQTVVLQEEDGGVAEVRSIASGAVYPGVGPEVAMLHQMGRLKVATSSDEEVIDAFFRVAKVEGIIIALESAHALAFAFRLAAERPPTERILVNLSGRGDKDVDYVLEHYGTGSEQERKQ